MSPFRTNPDATLLNNRSVRYIMLSGALLIVAIAVGTAIMVGDYRNRAVADNERELNNTALILSEQIDRTFQAIDLIESGVVQNIESLRIVSGDNYALQMSGSDINLMLKGRANGLIHVDNIYLVDSDGNLLNSSRDWPIPATNVADRDYFQTLKSDSNLLSLISRPLQGRVSGVWSIFFARKVKAPDGEFRGLVVGSIELSYFEEFFSSIALGDDSSITLYRNDGVVLARYPHKDPVLGQIFTPVINLLKNLSSGAIRFSTPLEGKDRLLAARRVPHYPLFVSAAVDTKTALADWKNETEMLLGSAIVVALAIAFMFFIIVRQVTRANSISERALSLEKERLYTAINNMPQGLMLFDSSERMVVCNRQFLEMYRLSPEVVKQGCAVREVLEQGRKTGNYTGDVAEYYSALSANLAQKEPWFQIETGDGRTIRIVSRSVKGGGWVSTHEDTTDRRKLEQERDGDRAARRDSEQMAEEIIAGSLDGFIQINNAGEVVEWNPSAEEIFGWSRQEALGKRLTDLYLPANYATRYEEINEHLRTADAGSKGGVRGEFDAVRKDGRKLKIEIAITAIRWRGSVIFNAFIRDLTKAIAVEEALRQSQKMESVGQLTGGVAHDFNNILTVITGSIDVLDDAVADRPELSTLTKLIGEAADRGAELTSRLLVFARKQLLKPRETNISALMTEVSKLLVPTLGENIEIDLRLKKAEWTALVDPGQLTTALLNLAVNARDAMPDGGKLTLETSNSVLDQGYIESYPDIPPGDYVMIAVSDTGGGIPEAIRQKVFEPFFTTKDVGKGTGLGLSMVYGFVKQSGGHIKIYSEIGHGTTFKIYLPRAGAQPEQIGKASGSLQIERGTETILVVEDDVLVRTTVLAQLHNLGYKTLSAANGAEAISIADRGDTFDLLFTDVIMPGLMNGRQLADEMAKRRSPLKVLFTSGYPQNAIIHHGRLDAGVLLLSKPYSKQNLARMLRQAIENDEVLPTGSPTVPHAKG
jgi:PAS domain S-box-containing protein